MTSLDPVFMLHPRTTGYLPHPRGSAPRIAGCLRSRFNSGPDRPLAKSGTAADFATPDLRSCLRDAGNARFAINHGVNPGRRFATTPGNVGTLLSLVAFTPHTGVLLLRLTRPDRLYQRFGSYPDVPRSFPEMTFPRASQALSRFTVLDLTRVRSGPTCVRQLADWGANVIKIDALLEDGGGEQPGGPRHGSDFQNLHRNKRAMTLNLKDPRGLEVFQRLAKQADVVVENFRPDVKTKLGIDYESVRRINPKIVYGSISGFGQDGPYHKRPGFDQIAQGMGGLMSITGAPGGGPMRVGIPVADLTAGMFCAMGILTALLEREVSGEGQWVQTSLLQAQIFMLDFQAARWLMEQDVPKQAGNNHPTSIPTGVFRTSDGYINIATTGGRIWERCAQAIGAPELVTNPDYATAPARSKNRDALNAEIERHTVTKSTESWVSELNAAGVPCGPIYSVDQMFADAQVKHLGIAQDVPNTENRHIRLVGQPVTLSRTPSKMAARPPEFGEQTDEVLAEFGFSAGEIAELRQRKVV
jgi:formyl-CoA transferase